MRLPKPYHRGRVLDDLSWRRCLKGLLVLFVFSTACEGVQRTYDVCAKTRQARLTETQKLDRLAGLQAAVANAQRTRAYYQSDAGITAAARSYGYGLPGERRIMFQPPAKRNAAP